MPTSKATLKAQRASLAGAHRWGTEWTGNDVAHLSEGSAIQVARRLGRTVFAIQSARHIVKSGGKVGGGGRSRQPEPRAYTFLGDDQPDW